LLFVELLATGSSPLVNFAVLAISRYLVVY